MASGHDLHERNTLGSGSPELPSLPSILEPEGSNPQRDTSCDFVIEAYLRRSLSIPHPTPLDLSALPNLVSLKKRPPIAAMIELAIWGSPSKRLAANEIYRVVEDRFPEMRGAMDKPWRRSIRHKLTNKKLYKREGRPLNEPGVGGYWSLDASWIDPSSRPRRRGRRSGTDSRRRARPSVDQPFEDGLQLSSIPSQSDASSLQIQSFNHAPPPPPLHTLPSSGAYQSDILYVPSQSDSSSPHIQSFDHVPSPSPLPPPPHTPPAISVYQQGIPYGGNSLGWYPASQLPMVQTPGLDFLSRHQWSSTMMDPELIKMDMGNSFPQGPQDRGYSLGSNPQLQLAVHPSEYHGSRTLKRPRSDSPPEDEHRRKRSFQPDDYYWWENPGY